MTKIVLAILLAAALCVEAQELQSLEGTWRGTCADCAPNAMPGGLARTLVISQSSTEIAIRSDGRPADIYRLDGTKTTLADGRTATASVDSGGVVITTVRTDARSRDEVYQTIMRSAYRLSGSTLRIERSTRAIRPNERPSERWVPLGTAVYQRN